MYVDNGTAKVPISAEIGVRVQGSTTKICDFPITPYILFPCESSIFKFDVMVFVASISGSTIYNIFV